MLHKALLCCTLLLSVEVNAFVANHAVSRVVMPHSRLPVSQSQKSVLGGIQMSDTLGRRAAMGLLAATSASAALPALADNVTPWPYSEFSRAVDEDRVEAVSFSADGRNLLVVDSDGVRHAVQSLPSGDADLITRLDKHNVRYAVQPAATEGGGPLGFAGSLLSTLLGPLLLFGGLYLLSRNQGGGGGMGGPMSSIGKSKSKLQLEPDTGVTFEDVAGCDQSKLELNEIVEFLKNPTKFSALGAKIPRGVVMEGPPGTGKTLLARAVAGEAGVPFMSASGSEFVEMFVGVGASRVRDMFTEAKKNAPCIVFIDEIDAVGRQRAGGGGGGMGGGNDEREQTLNQILTEMDGFEGNSGVIVIAATNRADILDSALLRPGRFDRRVPVDLPDKNGRFDILKVHVKGKPLAAEIDLELIAKRTIGFSGASLANLMNEAAIVAARRDKKEIGYDEVDYAIDRLTVGMQKNTETLSPNTQKLVAYHEAGHAIMGAMTPGYDTVGKITIIPRSNGAGGFTLFVPDQERMDSGMYSKRYLEDQLAVALGGRVAEEIVYGIDEVTTGASSDLQQVRNIARRMVAQWGMAGETLGFTAWEPMQQQGFMPEKNSPETEMAIEAEVKKIVTKAYDHCKQTLVANRGLLDELKDTLLEKETIDNEELMTLVDKLGVPGEPMPA